MYKTLFFLKICKYIYEKYLGDSFLRANEFSLGFGIEDWNHSM
jgi:hypothetical protein